MNYNKNLDLYEILGINKNSSQQVINSLVLKTSPKDNQEVGKALMVLSEPAKRKEYDKYGWKEEWERDWEKERNFRHAIFKEIQNYKYHYGNTYALKPDGFRVYVWVDEHLDPNLFAPSSGFVDKIWDIRGSNWKRELESFKNKVLVALDKAWEKEKKTPLLGDCWEGVENGNCAKCGKVARLRRKGKHSDGKDYCSSECYYENAYKMPKYEFQKAKFEIPEIEKSKLANYTCKKCGYEGYDCYDMDDRNYCCKPCFNKYLEELKNPDKHSPNRKHHFPNDKKSPEDPNYDRIKSLESKIKHYKRKKQDAIITEKEKTEVQKIIDDLEKQLKYERAKNFFSKKEDEGTIVWKTNRITGKTATDAKNPIFELLKWMKKEGIVNISLNSNGNLVVEYSGSQAQIVNDNNLTDEQKEIRKFFQQVKEQGSETYFNRNELEQFVNQTNNEESKEKQGNDKDWIIPMVIIGMGAIILFLVGVIIYKNKKRGY